MTVRGRVSEPISIVIIGVDIIKLWESHDCFRGFLKATNEFFKRNHDFPSPPKLAVIFAARTGVNKVLSGPTKNPLADEADGPFVLKLDSLLLNSVSSTLTPPPPTERHWI
ncbi:hypothetical protein EVAR_61330_1 [Eumeta japonica]|uniref:Uncharacterized protein n=1 Tax=Eumeta variegata TaxID=151549 RepID=A0A4C1Y579_EUMVA|nr:hypothetical protein EVAR_61330_1 [Eumeta japonica]